MAETQLTTRQTSNTIGISRQAIINGNFDIWQRGTSFNSANVYTADRWAGIWSNSSTTITQQSFTIGQTDVPNEPKYFIRSAVTSSAGAGNYSHLIQKIESVRSFAGQTVTLSFWAKADSAKDMTIEFYQNFGAGGSPSSSNTAMIVDKKTLTTGWVKYTVTGNVDSISGKTLGTTDDGFLAVLFWFDAGSTFNSRTDTLGQQSGTFDIAQVQLNAGSTALPFMPKSYAQELIDCQRYYQLLGKGSVGRYVGGNYVNVGYQFKVLPRAIGGVAPGLTTTSPTMFRTGIGNDTGSSSAITTSGGGWVQISNLSGGATNEICIMTSDYIVWDAEL